MNIWGNKGWIWRIWLTWRSKSLSDLTSQTPNTDSLKHLCLSKFFFFFFSFLCVCVCVCSWDCRQQSKQTRKMVKTGSRKGITWNNSSLALSTKVSRIEEKKMQGTTWDNSSLSLSSTKVLYNEGKENKKLLPCTLLYKHVGQWGCSRQ